MLERRVTRARSLVLPPLKKSERKRSDPGDYSKYLSKESPIDGGKLTKGEPEKDDTSLLGGTPASQSISKAVTKLLGMWIVLCVLAARLRPSRDCCDEPFVAYFSTGSEHMARRTR